jgi:nucleotide-binding universal stress UspA family protein
MFTTDGIHVEIEQGDKNLSKQVLDIQSQNPGSWIVSGSKMRSGLIRSVLGSFTDNIARQAIGPIVVVPDPKLTRQRKRSAHNATRDLAVSQ